MNIVSSYLTMNSLGILTIYIYHITINYQSYNKIPIISAKFITIKLNTKIIWRTDYTKKSKVFIK